MQDALRTTGALFRLAWQSVRRRPLSSTLTALAVALGVALVVAVDTIQASAGRSYTEAARGYDVVLGPTNGSPLQTVLATLFQLDAPPATVPWSVYEDAQEDPRVSAAVPYAMGDTFHGHAVVATTAEMFSVLSDRAGRALGDGVQGRLFRPARFEVVLGSAAAQATGYQLGDALKVSHGFVEGGHVHAEQWDVVGVLRPTGTPHDRAVYMPIETFYAIPGHDAGSADAGDEHEDEHADDEHEHEPAHEGEHAHEDEHEDGPQALSAVGIRLKSPTLRLAYLQEFRSGRHDAQAILPVEQVRKLMNVVGDVNRGFRLVAWLVTVVAAMGILVGLYNTIHGRRREIAILRALGARPRHVFTVILLEALFLCLLGGALGLLLGQGAVAAAAPTLEEAYGVRVQVGEGLDLVLLLGGLVALGLLAGLLPAWRGLSTPVAENLHPDA